MEIELSNIGPIKKLTFDLDGPGVYVARGTNGSGKSTMLRAVARRLGGNGDLSVYDGAARGSLALGDARLTVTQSRVAAGGELEVIGIESALDIGSLVDPGIKNPAKADDYRLKSLLALSGVQPDPSIFHELVGGETEFIALGVDAEGADALLLAARVKRAIEQKARAHEESADAWAQKAAVAKKSAEGAPDGESDENKLAHALAAAQSRWDQMIAENQRSDAAADAARLAAKQLAELGQLSENVDDLNGQRTDKLTRRNAYAELQADLRAKRANIERQIEQFEIDIEALDSEEKELRERIARAEAAAKKRQELADAAARAVPAGYTAEETAEAAEAIETARHALENGALIRHARAKAAEASQHATASKIAAREARRLRDAASGVDGALSKLLPANCPLRVEAGRLVTATDRGQSELYADLSDGERWAVALKLAAHQLPAGGMLTLDQIAWESFAPSLQTEIAAMVKTMGLRLITAAVADGPLRVERFAPAEESTAV